MVPCRLHVPEHSVTRGGQTLDFFLGLFNLVGTGSWGPRKNQEVEPGGKKLSHAHKERAVEALRRLAAYQLNVWIVQQGTEIHILQRGSANIHPWLVDAEILPGGRGQQGQSVIAQSEAEENDAWWVPILRSAGPT